MCPTKTTVLILIFIIWFYFFRRKLIDAFNFQTILLTDLINDSNQNTKVLKAQGPKYYCLRCKFLKKSYLTKVWRCRDQVRNSIVKKNSKHCFSKKSYIYAGKSSWVRYEVTKRTINLLKMRKMTAKVKRSYWNLVIL